MKNGQNNGKFNPTLQHFKVFNKILFEQYLSVLMCFVLFCTKFADTQSLLSGPFRDTSGTCLLTLFY